MDVALMSYPLRKALLRSSAPLRDSRDIGTYLVRPPSASPPRISSVAAAPRRTHPALDYANSRLDAAAAGRAKRMPLPKHDSYLSGVEQRLAGASTHLRASMRAAPVSRYVIPAPPLPTFGSVAGGSLIIPAALPPAQRYLAFDRDQVKAAKLRLLMRLDLVVQSIQEATSGPLKISTETKDAVKMVTRQALRGLKGVAVENDEGSWFNAEAQVKVAGNKLAEAERLLWNQGCLLTSTRSASPIVPPRIGAAVEDAERESERCVAQDVGQSPEQHQHQQHQRQHAPQVHVSRRGSITISPQRRSAGGDAERSASPYAAATAAAAPSEGYPEDLALARRILAGQDAALSPPQRSDAAARAPPPVQLHVSPGVVASAVSDLWQVLQTPGGAADARAAQAVIVTDSLASLGEDWGADEDMLAELDRLEEMQIAAIAGPYATNATAEAEEVERALDRLEAKRSLAYGELSELARATGLPLGTPPRAANRAGRGAAGAASLSPGQGSGHRGLRSLIQPPEEEVEAAERASLAHYHRAAEDRTNVVAGDRSGSSTDHRVAAATASSLSGGTVSESVAFASYSSPLLDERRATSPYSESRRPKARDVSPETKEEHAAERRALAREWARKEAERFMALEPLEDGAAASSEEGLSTQLSALPSYSALAAPISLSTARAASTRTPSRRPAPPLGPPPRSTPQGHYAALGADPYADPEDVATPPRPVDRGADRAAGVLPQGRPLRVSHARAEFSNRAEVFEPRATESTAKAKTKALPRGLGAAPRHGNRRTRIAAGGAAASPLVRYLAEGRRARQAGGAPGALAQANSKTPTATSRMRISRDGRIMLTNAATASPASRRGARNIRQPQSTFLQ